MFDPHRELAILLAKSLKSAVLLIKVIMVKLKAYLSFP